MHLEAVTITVEGTVQRVGFRRFAEKTARKFKLAGYVENMKDGTVKLFMQGDHDSIDNFIKEVQIAPPPIVVDDIITRKSKPSPRIKNNVFRIKVGPLGMEMQEGFGVMESQFTDYRTEFKDFAARTDENFKTMGDKYGEISSKLTQMLETLERESTETRKELTRAVDKLSNLVDQYIRSQQERNL